MNVRFRLIGFAVIILLEVICLIVYKKYSQRLSGRISSGACSSWHSRW